MRETAGRRRLGGGAALAALIVGLAGCSGMPSIENPFARGDAAPAEAAAVPNLAPDDRGVITYATYQVVVAREGDTMQTVAGRLGITADALASRNALPPDYRLRAGEVLLLPDGVARPSGGLGAGEITTRPLGWSPERAGAAIEGGAAASQENPFQGGQTEPLIDPVRHRVEPGETAYSIARLYGVSVTALASWNGLGPDLALRENQELLIPIVSDANRISGAADTQPGEGTAVGAPPSAAAALPEDIATAAAPESPNLGQFRTPPGGRLSPPVNAAVSRPFDAARPNGVGYAVPAGTPVRAAASGEVALISEELGGLGAIVLIRHRDDLMTTYATLSDVAVRQGDTVQAGQVIGEVSARDRPELQFDVFRGTSSVDPTPYIGG